MPRSYWYHSLAALLVAAASPFWAPPGLLGAEGPTASPPGGAWMGGLLLAVLIPAAARLSIRSAGHFRFSAFLPLHLLALAGVWWAVAFHFQRPALSILLLALAAARILDGENSAGNTVITALLLAGACLLLPASAAVLPAFALVALGRGWPTTAAILALPIAAASVSIFVLGQGLPAELPSLLLRAYRPHGLLPLFWSSTGLLATATISPFALPVLAALSLRGRLEGKDRLVRFLLLAAAVPLALVPVLAGRGDNGMVSLGWGMLAWAILCAEGAEMFMRMGAGRFSPAWSGIVIVLYLVPPVLVTLL